MQSMARISHSNYLNWKLLFQQQLLRYRINTKGSQTYGTAVSQGNTFTSLLSLVNVHPALRSQWLPKHIHIFPNLSSEEQNKDIPQKTEIHSGHTVHQLSVPCREVSSLPNTKLIMQSISALQSILWHRLVRVVRVPPMLGNALIISSIHIMHFGAIPMGPASWFVTVCLDGFSAVVRL